MLQQQTWGERFIDVFIIGFLLIISLVCLLPFVHVVAGSFATSEELLRQPFMLIPTEYSLDAYRYIFSSDSVIRSMMITIWITVAGTAINLLLTALTAYPLARKDLDGRRLIMLLIVFTLMFNGGMIPQFLVIKSLGLLDSLWSLLLPTAIHAFYLIILKNFFQQLPASLEESAKIDGCNDVSVLFRIVVPLSLPAMATLTLFYAVLHWNTFMHAILYINDADKWPIQVLLRSIVLLSEGGIGDSMATSADVLQIPPESVKMAVITVATLPILIVYPFLQKHFAKGILLGSVKG